MKPEYAIVIKNKTRLEALIERFNTVSQAEFYIERNGGNFKEYVEEHQRFQDSFVKVQTQLSKVIKNKVVDRSFVSSFIFAENMLIIVVGQDGLVANVAKYSKSLPIIAVNPDPETYDGVLLPFSSDTFMHAVHAVLNGNYTSRKMSFAEVKLNDGQKLLAVNDLFIGMSSHSSARYKLCCENEVETQSSSGIIVSTKTGSTGWLSSVFAMAQGILGMDQTFFPKLNEDDLFFAVREPFKSKITGTEICGGKIQKGETLCIESLMPSGGYIFSDGIEQDFLQFNSGATATIGISENFAVLVTPYR